jgi:hypothetical protein
MIANKIAHNIFYKSTSLETLIENLSVTLIHFLQVNLTGDIAEDNIAKIIYY